MEAAPGERRRLRQLPEGETAAEGEPLLVAELTPGRPQQYDWKSSCETWSVAFSPDGAWFAWSQGHCVVKLLPWPLQGTKHNGKALERKGPCAKTKPRGCGGPKEKTLDCGQIVWGLAFSSWLPPQPHKYLHQATTPCLILATGLNDGQIKVWEVQTGGLLFNLSGHQDVVRGLSFAPGKSRSILVSASRDKTLRVWDLSQNGKQLKVLSGHMQWIYCCSISPDGQMLCSVAGEKSALLWSMQSYRLLRKLEGHQGCVASCDFSPDSALLATASYDTFVILWDPCTGDQLRSLWFLRIWGLELGSPVAFAPVKNGLCCTYFPHGGIIATGTRDGHAQFWTAPQSLSSLKHLCRKVLRGCFTSYQVQALSIPKKMKEFLTYRTL
ncbi:WD repeat and SOCS box-containing protein 2 isoform X2 [Candoia aspera]|uniref:WD repeat and SOCS box-containing protein 2 isoform X2 n=1 Tax=Candoia aspera TaxID=51853 RepID=UPI002FD8348D